MSRIDQKVKTEDEARAILKQIKHETNDRLFGVSGIELDHFNKIRKKGRGQFANLIRLIKDEEMKLRQAKVTESVDHATESQVLRYMLHETAGYVAEGAKKLIPNTNDLITHYNIWLEARVGNLELLEAGCLLCCSVFSKNRHEDPENSALLNGSERRYTT